MAKDTLAEYSAKRTFGATPEPRPAVLERRGPLLFVIQQHAARRLHFDLRLECDGVLKSWAVPKGASLDPQAKHLAMQTEDHPFDYGSFEGVIPAGQYGAGEVIVWDCGGHLPTRAGRGSRSSTAIACSPSSTRRACGSGRAAASSSRGPSRNSAPSSRSRARTAWCSTA